MTAFEDRVAGAALGQAVGDALGFHVERQGPEAAAAFALAWLRGAPGPEPMRGGFPVGQVSDDTQCSQVLVGEALRLGRHDRAAHARALVRSVGRLVGSGSNTRRMLGSLASAPGFDEGDLDRALSIRDTALAHAPHLPTNGVAMRAWPHAVLFAGRAALADSVLADAALTHAHPESGACAVTCALATRLLFEGVAVADLLDRLEREMPVRGEVASLALARRLLDLAPRAAADAVWSVSGEPPEWRSVSPAALPTVAWALRSLVAGGGSVEEVLREALSCGGDVDTTAALAGGWYGAAHGPDSLPAHVAVRVRDRDAWGFHGLVARARAFAALGEEAAR